MLEIVKQVQNLELKAKKPLLQKVSPKRRSRFTLGFENPFAEIQKSRIKSIDEIRLNSEFERMKNEFRINKSRSLEISAKSVFALISAYIPSHPILSISGLGFLESLLVVYIHNKFPQEIHNNFDRF